MDAFKILGGCSLNGELSLGTAKNALLPILACSIISSDTVVIQNVSMFTDVLNMIDILNSLGVTHRFEGTDLILNPSNADKFFVGEEYTKKVRSSIFMLGPLLSRFRFATTAYPGGCNIGTRPIDLHLKGLRALNVKIKESHGYIYCDGQNMKASEIHLDFPSVGATENLMMACVKLSGTSKIYNAAKEPEIEDLQNFLNSMGAKISGAGTSTIVIEGVDKLSQTIYLPISDRIITGTYLIAVAITGGRIKLKNVNPEHNTAVITKLKEAGVKIGVYKNSITATISKRPKAITKIETLPYPGFPTDLQSQMLSLESISQGTSMIVENLFESRFKVYTELIKMGADITIRDRMAIVNGVPRLSGASLSVPDLRGGACLVLAGLNADGYTTVNDVSLIDRGYYKMEQDLRSLGADIKRITI